MEYSSSSSPNRESSALAHTFSASTASAFNYSFDVFINHRGVDVKLNFASHLYRRLKLHGVKAFLDVNQLTEGESISQIIRAIAHASLHVAIFSPRYAESHWCLDELVRMLESQAPIIPVFYKVKPAELRWTEGKDGVYARALRKLQERKTLDTIKSWREALATVAHISGFELEACNGDEGELLDKVVEAVLKFLRTASVAKYPTGLGEVEASVTKYSTSLDKDFENTVFKSKAASSAAKNTSSDLCDVFINYHGLDTKKGFAGHLYHRLRSHGICVFLDRQGMQEGDNLIPQIVGAIKTASVQVAIFSPGYAESSLFLEELVLMLESIKSGATIITIFYGVKPADLRWTKDQNQGYAKDLLTLQKKATDEGRPRYDLDTIEKWRGALSSVADIEGLDLQAFNDEEGELVEKIVERVLIMMKKPRFTISKSEIGLDAKVKDFEDKVLSQQKQTGKPQVVGIVGLSGIGKTTLAEEVFRKKSSSYPNSCFFPVSRTSLQFLFGEVLKRLTRSDLQINSVPEVKKLFQDCEPSLEMINRYPSLVVLDEVDGADQWDALLPIQEVLHSDSLILITTEYRDVLTSSGVEESSIYNLSGLNWQHSEELFCLNAFGQVHPLPEFEDLVDEFLTALDGLPLSLKTFGQDLHGNDHIYWEAELKKLQQTLPYDIEKAKYSSGLNRKVKDLKRLILLQQQSKRLKVVGVVGLGGEGKTTLGKEFFKRKSSHYSKSCFINDASTSSLHSLLSKLLKGLTQLDLQLDTVDEAIDLFKRHVSSFPSLVILDDVVHPDQLHALLSVLNVLPSSSLILITSRDKDVLNRSGVQESSIYELNGLNPQDSLKLFCSHAFSQPSPLPGFEDIVDDFLTACNGSPLLLKVFGALLGGKADRSYWQDQLSRLQRSPNDIKKKLKVSYDALTIEEQHIFLHIACSCIGQKRDLAIRLLAMRLLDESGSRSLLGFESLQKMYLVELDDENCIIMHEHLRDLGRTLADETGLRRPVWSPTKNNRDLLQPSSNEEVITERLRNIDDLLQQSSIIREVRAFMIVILVMMIVLMMMTWSVGLTIILITMITAMMAWRMG